MVKQLPKWEWWLAVDTAWNWKFLFPLFHQGINSLPGSSLFWVIEPKLGGSRVGWEEAEGPKIDQLWVSEAFSLSPPTTFHIPPLCDRKVTFSNHSLWNTALFVLGPCGVSNKHLFFNAAIFKMKNRTLKVHFQSHFTDPRPVWGRGNVWVREECDLWTFFSRCVSQRKAS